MTICRLAIFAMSAAAAAGAVAAEECIFDQAAQLRHYRELEGRIEGSRFDEVEGLLIVDRGTETITLRRGGCVHFGLLITHAMPATQTDSTREAIFARAVALVAEFGGDGLVTAEEVTEAIHNDAFEMAQDGSYSLRVPGVENFSITWGISGARLTVEVAYYIN